MALPARNRLPAGSGWGTGGRVALVVRDGCHLCAAARDVVAEVCAASGDSWHELDCDDPAEPDLARWSESVPVVLVDGEQVDCLRIDAERLARALQDGVGRRRWWR